MTAQLAILNKSSVALAADSAATVIVDGVVKIHQSNKLFALREDEPIGVMVYGNAEFMGVPWATLIDMYRSSATSQGRTVREYVKDFLKFIKDPKICNSDAEVEYATQVAISALYSVRMDVDANSQDRTRDKGAPLTRRERNDLFRSIIERTLQNIDEARPFKTIDPKQLDIVFKKVLAEADEFIERMLDNYDVYKPNRKDFFRPSSAHFVWLY